MLIKTNEVMIFYAICIRINFFFLVMYRAHSYVHLYEHIDAPGNERECSIRVR